MSVPGASNPLLLSSAAGAAAGYEIERSLRFNSADSAYLNRTPASAGNRKTWTWAGWAKRAALGSIQFLFTGTLSGSGGSSSIAFNSDDTIYFRYKDSGASFTTTALFRDPSAWYHIVAVADTDNATADDRLAIYVNGVRQNGTIAAPTLGQSDGYINFNNVHFIGTQSTTYSNFYLADVHFIDGQALDPTDFGEFDEDTGVWNPIEYAGTYGTNGFHLPFNDNSSASALGTDDSGNGNNWTVNNLSVASGSGNDSLRDSPTNGNTANDTGLGGEVPGNYCTWNPLSQMLSPAVLSNGNLRFEATSNGGTTGTFGMQGGKWYWELDLTNVAGSQVYTGITNITSTTVDRVANSCCVRIPSGALYNVNGATTEGSGTATQVTGDVLSFAYDADNAKFFIALNGTWDNSGDPAAGTGASFTNVQGDTLYPLLSDNSSTGVILDVNFGQRPFAYSAPSGFKPLATPFLDDPLIADGSTVMDAVLYDGNGSTQTISGLNFSPDLVWLKSRSDGDDHSLQDTVRGAGNNRLRTNQTNSENTQSGQISSFNSDGWTMGNRTNESGRTYVGWAWDAGSSTVTNTDGSISSSVRANPTAGFSIVSYTGTGANATVGHGLNAAPEFAIFKVRSTDNNWGVYHKSLGATDQIKLNQTASTSSSVSFFQNTEPTSSVIYLGADSTANYGSETMIAYCFAPVEGYSAFGSYTGTQPFIYTGFRPRWIMVRRYDVAASEWVIFDSARSGYNGDNDTLCANRSSSENAFVGSNELDILSNGFKFTVTRAITNGSDNYIYACFAESPFRSARAR